MSPRPLTASIVVIGDEILGGFTQDTNSSWLAERLQAQGVELRRISTVPDEFEEIDAVLRAALSRPRPHLVLTTGGIGSTPDDITYEAVAATLGRELVDVPEMARRIDGAIAWTVEQGLDVDDEFVDHMMRMARVPQGAQLLRSSTSWAPGIQVDVDGGLDEPEGACIVVLPGVPPQLRTIVTEAVEPDLLAGRGRPEIVAEVAHEFPESALNHCLVRVIGRYPEVKVGSYPGDPMVVRLRGRPVDVMAARDEVEDHVRDLEDTEAGQRLVQAWRSRVRGRDRS
jgi:molybdenum cofactor synthesis domain-containing protein